jgi:predicted Fe-Mo cluster-binding NifX family protein
MKIAVTSQGPGLDSMMDQRFGRCPYILLVETEDMTYEALMNPYAQASGGVGSRLASLVADRGVHTVVTEECGPHARDALEAAGIHMVALCADTVRQAVEACKAQLTGPGSGRAAADPPQAGGAAVNPLEADEGHRAGRQRRRGRGGDCHGEGGERRRSRRQQRRARSR